MHKKWSEKETPEELKEDLEAMKEERELSEQLKGPGPLCNTSGNVFWFRLVIYGIGPKVSAILGFGIVPKPKRWFRLLTNFM